MKPAEQPPGTSTGQYEVVCASASATREWAKFVAKHTEAAVVAWERLANHPLSRIPGRQFPLKGAQNKPFWEYEATGAYRVYYAVCLDSLTVMIAICNDAHDGRAVGRLVETRGADIRQMTSGSVND